MTIGGELGPFTWRPEADGITVGPTVGAGTIIGDPVSYNGTTLTIPPVGNLTSGGGYYLEITASDITGLPVGNYLAQAAFPEDADGNPTGPIELRDIRAIVNGIARDPIARLDPGTSTGVALACILYTSPSPRDS